MSIIFGMKLTDGSMVHERALVEMADATRRWTTEGTVVLTKDQVGMGIQPYRAHGRAKLELGPTLDGFGNLVCLDGRIDNYKELCDLLDIRDPDTPDSAIVLSAFSHWGEKCFSRFVGDWALVLWAEGDQTLYLARDHAGTRSLFYRVQHGRTSWATYLETLLTHPEPLRLDDRYVARYIACRSTDFLTPFESIAAVPHAHYIKICDGVLTHHPHWEGTSSSKISYPSDEEYEEHFRFLFRQAVARRLDGGSCVLAELSGGMDSSSIVAMADHIRGETRDRGTGIIHTVSYFIDSEKSWDERPYVEMLESSRQHTGHHVNLPEQLSNFQVSEIPYPLPGATRATINREETLARALGVGSYHVVLSGIGGDEVLGGAPSHDANLATDLLDGNVGVFLRSAVSWSLAGRVPLLHTLKKAVRYAVDAEACDRPSLLVPWLRECSAQVNIGKNAPSDAGVFPSSLRLRRANNHSTLLAVVETMPHTKHPHLWRPEFRYPYLDRDLLAFLWNIPHQQIALPGRRRHLMRRALKDLVPHQILERRRKAFIIRSPLESIRRAQPEIEQLLRSSRVADRGLVEVDSLERAIHDVSRGVNIQFWAPIVRTIQLELWLRSLESNGAIRLSA